jgi:hypothetical protein
VVDTNQPSDRRDDSAMLSVPEELVPIVHELKSLYSNGNKDSVIRALSDLILQLKTEPHGNDAFSASFPMRTAPNHASKPKYHVLVNQAELDDPVGSEFLKSWEDILNLQLYVDTEIYGTLDFEPVQPEGVVEHEAVVEHEDATEIYVQSWAALAESMSNLPNDAFTRLWSTAEVAKILECSASTLRRARKESRLPLKVKDLIVDCVSHDGKRSLWFVRPS